MMATGKPGADSSVLVTSHIGGKSLVELATDLYGEPPVFWGRYFTSASTAGTVEYRHLKENNILRENGIRVLPIVRQTKRVDGDEAVGSADGIANAHDILVTFGAGYLQTLGEEFYVFLDVEGAPSLSQAYYTGLASSLSGHSSAATGGAVTLLSCVYATRSDSVTWSAMSAAAATGVECYGIWVARWTHHGCHVLDEWDDARIQPKVSIPCPVLCWQYSDDCHGGGGFDCSQTNPSMALDDLLNHLILPPGSPAW
jgi:hypothetical protein